MAITHVHGASLAITATALILCSLIPAEIKYFTAFFSILSATASLAVAICLWASGWRPALEPDIQPIKAVLADYAGFWGGAAILLLLIVAGRLPG